MLGGQYQSIYSYPNNAVHNVHYEDSFKIITYHYCRTHNVRVCLYVAYIASGSASLYIKTLYFFLTVLSLSAAATVANIKIRYDAKTPNLLYLGHASYVCSTLLVSAAMCSYCVNMYIDCFPAIMFCVLV